MIRDTAIVFFSLCNNTSSKSIGSFLCELGAPAQLTPPLGTPLFSLCSTGGYTYAVYCAVLIEVTGSIATAVLPPRLEPFTRMNALRT